MKVVDENGNCIKTSARERGRTSFNLDWLRYLLVSLTTTFILLWERALNYISRCGTENDTTTSNPLATLPISFKPRSLAEP